MKLLIQLNYFCILLFYFTACSQLTTARDGSLCNLDKFSAFSAKSRRSFTTIDILHTDNESFSLEFSWNVSTNSCQASIVRLIASGSHIAGPTTVNLDLSEDDKLLLQKCRAFCKALQMEAKKAGRIKQLFLSRKARLLQESNPIAGNEDGSFNSDVYVASNQSGSSNLTIESSGSSSNSDNGGHRNKKALAMEIVFPIVGFLLLLALCSALIFGRKDKKANVSTIEKSTLYSNDSVQKSMTRGQQDEALLENLASVGLPPRFTYAEMDTATNGFTKKLGEGGYGAVFEGALAATGIKIAVKVFLDTASTACRNGFCKEVMSIGEKKHQNLVQLRGFCVEDEHRMLVYELMENGSLNKLLFGGKASEKSNQLHWERRRAIAIDTARALAFLHEDGEQKRALIHCDVKPENILLNENWVAKVSDFGLAKLLWGASTKHYVEDDHDGSSDGGRHSPSDLDASSTWDAGCLSSLISSKGIRGTLGYLAPEWIRMDAGPDSITIASDVYSFGVVLLELIAGRRSMVPGRPFLLGEAFDMLANGDDLSNLLDPHLLEGSPLGTSAVEDLEDVRNFVKVALWCLQEDIALRPTMATIVTMLTNKELVSSPPFCEYFAGSSHFFDEVDYPLRENIFSSDTFSSHNKDRATSNSTSSDQRSWQISILSAR
ncbi:hypothetical protein GOP47_0000601 [Adiantum capillus-veneris]|uniref:Protein kinase domain-containing protein n=1 Tax=Adiantum capillus-veneris TaxID=13818 RepID=A0A9D4VFF5_ADICA|nr:hypothetical protein GOP47_0000601 [Adiantum capillus-veneris]